MPIELSMLALTVVWLFVMIMVTAMLNIGQQSVGVLVGPRDNLPEPSGLVARGKRATANLVEGLIMFAPFVLILAVQDGFTAQSAMGAQLFFYSRIGHGLLYFAGVPWLRSIVWMVGIVGTIMVALPVLF